MNDVYFGCGACRIMTDAGYRWAYVHLEVPGIVERGTRVSVKAVLAARDYWSGVEVSEASWLRDEVLPTVRAFLETHATHSLFYGESEELVGEEPTGFLDWLEIGSRASPTPRWFLEIMHLRTWAEVVEWTRENRAPWWWGLEDLKDSARVRFAELVKGAGQEP